MKNKTTKIFGIVYSVLGLLFAMIPFLIVPVCTKKMPNGLPMPCFYTGNIEVLLGGILFGLGILVFFAKDRIMRVLLGLFTLVIGFLCLAYPLFIIGGCRKIDMRCHIYSFPALYLVSGIIMFIAIVFTLISLKKDK